MQDAKNRDRRLPILLLLTVAAMPVPGCGARDAAHVDAGKAESARAADTRWLDYPEARRVAQVDVYHDVEIEDPYRWLEDEASPETQAWLSRQDAITERFFSRLGQHRKVTSYLDSHWLDGVVSIPVRQGDNTFYFEAVEGKPHHVLHVRRGEGEPQVVFDLNENDPDGLRTTRTSITTSPEGRYVGYPIHHAGADAAEIHFYDTREGRTLDEVIPTAYSYVTSWLPDESGFYYTYVDIPTMMGQPTDKRPGVYLHRMGTSVDSDPLVFARPWQGRYMAMGILADDEENLLIQNMNIMGSRGGWGVRPMDGDADTEITWLIDPDAEFRFAYVGSSGSEVFLCTDYESPNWRIVAADLGKPGLENLRQVVPERKEPISIIAGTNSGHVVLHDERLYVTYIQHTTHVVRIFDLEGKELGGIDLPFPGTVSTIATKEDDPVLYVGLQSFLVPQSTYAYDSASQTLSPMEVIDTRGEFDDYEVKQVFYTSQDGTRVPMTIIRRQGAVRDGKDKVLLYGYGGWGIPLLPRFDNRVHAWLQMGGTYAIANLRGGGEYGDTWHKAGQFFNKQDVFNDFFAAAEYLVDESYTTASRITILGGSNGGLLTAACYNQRPELFGAVVSEVAAVDMLRIQDTPIGQTVTMELGSPNQSQEMFDYLLSYSPLHNVRHEGPYPPILHMVGENDPRCKPGHIYKYVAESQREDAAERVSLLRLVRGAGHGSHRKDDQIAWAADELAFAWAMTE